MDRFTPVFLADALAGEPVYVADVRNAYAKLPERASFDVVLVPEGVDSRAGAPAYCLSLPRFAAYPDAEKEFVVDFFLASANNLVAGLGGARLDFAAPGAPAEAAHLLAAFAKAFGTDSPRHRRSGYGRSVNVAERVADALRPGRDGGGFRLAPVGEAAPRTVAAGGSGALERFRAAVRGLDGRRILGMDIGGTDIKMAVAEGGRLAGLYEFDWNPALATRASQVIEPVVGLVRLLGAAAAIGDGAGQGHGVGDVIRRIFAPGVEADAVAEALSAFASRAAGRDARFDAIGLCFPDVVVGNRIVGGESPKTMGMREAFGAEYDREFAALTRLDELLLPHVRPGGRVAIVNDGAMAAFTTGVELAASRPDEVAAGVFSHTLGTDFGTGWVDGGGGIPDIPLEVYTFIVDLGSRPDRAFPAADVRSDRNVNNGLPGTMQKVAGQGGVFRLAVKHLSARRPDLLDEMRRLGFLADRDGLLHVPESPRDMRKPFLEHVMALVARERDPDVERIFLDVGVGLAAAAAECDWIFRPAAAERMLFGRLVKKADCFALMRRGAAERGAGDRFAAADADLAATPLMRELAANPEYTVAQFAQAVGAIHFGNAKLNERVD